MAQAGLGSEHRNKCGHAGCDCVVGPGDHFCSTYCATASEAQVSGTLPGQRQQGGACQCGHPDCRHETASRH